MFILWAFSLQERTDYASETFTVMGHNPWKHLDGLDYCPWTASPFYLYAYYFSNFLYPLILKYYLYNKNSYICLCSLEHSPEVQTHKFTGYLTSLFRYLLGIPIWTYIQRNWAPKLVLLWAIPISVSDNPFSSNFSCQNLGFIPGISLFVITTHPVGHQLLWALLSKYIWNPNNTLISTATNLVCISFVPLLDYFNWLPLLYLSFFAAHSIFSTYLPVWSSENRRLNLINIVQWLHISLRVKTKALTWLIKV